MHFVSQTFLEGLPSRHHSTTTTVLLLPACVAGCWLDIGSSLHCTDQHHLSICSQPYPSRLASPLRVSVFPSTNHQRTFNWHHLGLNMALITLQPVRSPSCQGPLAGDEMWGPSADQTCAPPRSYCPSLASVFSSDVIAWFSFSELAALLRCGILLLLLLSLFCNLALGAGGRSGWYLVLLCMKFFLEDAIRS